jgi:hypothetical protein
MAEEDRKEHHQVKNLLKEFQNMHAESVDYVPKLKELWQVLSKHLKEEEERDLPALEDALRSVEGESEKMASEFGLTKAFVPTRSHPSAGENPYFESAMGILAAPIDQIAGIFRKFPSSRFQRCPGVHHTLHYQT